MDRGPVWGCCSFRRCQRLPSQLRCSCRLCRLCRRPRLPSRPGYCSPRFQVCQQCCSNLRLASLDSSRPCLRWGPSHRPSLMVRHRRVPRVSRPALLLRPHCLRRRPTGRSQQARQTRQPRSSRISARSVSLPAQPENDVGRSAWVCPDARSLSVLQRRSQGAVLSPRRCWSYPVPASRTTTRCVPSPRCAQSG
jgi:hypothetical protein